MRFNELYIVSIHISFEKNTLHKGFPKSTSLGLGFCPFFGLVISAFPVALLFVDLYVPTLNFLCCCSHNSLRQTVLENAGGVLTLVFKAFHVIIVESDIFRYSLKGCICI